MSQDERDYVQERRRKEVEGWTPLEDLTPQRREALDAMWGEVERPQPARNRTDVPTRRALATTTRGGEGARLMTAVVIAVLTTFFVAAAYESRQGKGAPLPLPRNGQYIAQGVLGEEPVYVDLNIRNISAKEHAWLTFTDSQGVTVFQVAVAPGQGVATQLPVGVYAGQAFGGTAWFGPQNKFSSDGKAQPLDFQLLVQEGQPVSFDVFTPKPVR